MNTLVVFASQREAQIAGFAHGRHRANEHVQGWWPSLGQTAIARRPLAAIFVTRRASDCLTTEDAALLRKRQDTFGDAAVWVEL